MAEEADDPGRDVPRAINCVIVVVLVVYIGMPLAGLSVMRVGANVVPVDAATRPDGAGRRWCRASRRGRGCSRATRETTVYVPVERRATATSSRRRSRPARSRSWAGSRSRVSTARSWAATTSRTRCWGWCASCPTSVGWLRGHPGALGRHPGRDDPAHRHQRRADRGVAAHLLPGPAPPAAAGARPHPRQAPDSLRVDHRLRRRRLRCSMFPGRTGLLADLYIFGSMISFTAAHVSVIVLRIREPELERPWRPPFNIPWRGQLAAAHGRVRRRSARSACGWSSSPSRARAASSPSAGSPWGSSMYVVYRRAKGYSLTKTVAKVVMPRVHAGRHRLQPDPRAHRRARGSPTR